MKPIQIFKNYCPLFIVLALGWGLTACAVQPVSGQMVQKQTLSAVVAELYTQQAITPSPAADMAVTPMPEATQTPLPTVTGTPTPDVRPDPNQWTQWPVLPTVSGVVKELYLRGQQMGNDPRKFSSIGDCQSEPNVFMGIYETKRYWLGQDFQYLQETINYYNGSFSHKSQSVRDGLSAPSALSPLWADKTTCDENENPVDCELRLNKPSIVFINLGTNWKPGAPASRYESYLRKIVEDVIAHGAIPVLSTKADNVEGDNSLNLATARVAHDYDIPLWNFWLAAQSLPNGGMDKDRDNIYLTPDGWDRRNFTGLETLNTLQRELIQLTVPTN